MRAFSIFFLLFLTIVTHTSYADLKLPTRCFVQPTQAYCEMINPLAFPVYCQGRLVAQTYYGNYLWSSIQTWVPAQGFAYQYVYSYPSNPIVSSQVEIICQ